MYHLSATICYIYDTSISSYVTHILDNTENCNEEISVATLSNKKVIITYGLGSDYKLKAMICTTSNIGTAKKEIEIQLSSFAKAGKIMSTLALSSSKIFIAHSNLSSMKLRGRLCNIVESNGVLKLQNSTDKIHGIAQTSGVAGAKVNIYTPKV